MNKKIVSIIVIAAVMALGAAGALAYRDSIQQKPASVAQNESVSSAVQADTNSATYKMYADMTGETYDRNFIANMIAHHQGAVDMAKLALTSAKHQELKDMANDIVSAQEKEIADMLAWQKAWGYPSTSAEDMQDHSAMGMMDTMAGMTIQLDGKTGDDFDKTFLEQMILHHQSAIDMAAPGEKNANRREVKDLTVAIVKAQSKEIAQMQTWQKEWGYRN